MTLCNSRRLISHCLPRPHAVFAYSVFRTLKATASVQPRRPGAVWRLRLRFVHWWPACVLLILRISIRGLFLWLILSQACRCALRWSAYAMLPLLTRDADFELGDAECKCRRRSMYTTLIPLCLLNRHWLRLFSPSVSAHSRANGGSGKSPLAAHIFHGPVPFIRLRFAYSACHNLAQATHAFCLDSVKVHASSRR